MCYEAKVEVLFEEKITEYEDSYSDYPPLSDMVHVRLTRWFGEQDPAHYILETSVIVGGESTNSDVRVFTTTAVTRNEILRTAIREYDNEKRNHPFFGKE